MIIIDLDFHPQVIWAREDGFHSFGYHSPNLYCHQRPYSRRLFEVENEIVDITHVSRDGKTLMNKKMFFKIDSPLITIRKYMHPEMLKNTFIFAENFDFNEHHLVVTWDKAIWINMNYKIFQNCTKCADAKISPDSTKLIIAEDNKIHFMRINDLVIVKTCLINGIIKNLAYSKDGITVAAVTQDKQMVIVNAN